MIIGGDTFLCVIDNYECEKTINHVTGEIQEFIKCYVYSINDIVTIKLNNGNEVTGRITKIPTDSMYGSMIGLDISKPCKEDHDAICLGDIISIKKAYGNENILIKYF